MNLYPILDDLYIQDRETGVVGPWHRNWAQEEYIGEFHRQWNDRRPVRIIVLKARQLGISTATGAIGFSLSFVIPNNPGLIIAHEMDSSEHLLGISKRYWETFRQRRLYSPKYLSRKHLAWKETDSSLQVVTAKNASAGRSRTLRFVHGSEVGFWDNARELMLGLRQTVPEAWGTFIALESTANGIGNYFYDTWHKALAGDNDYVPMFFPWWRHHEYMASTIGLEYRALKDMTAEEKGLERIMRAGADGRGRMDPSEVRDRLTWRRWAIQNLCDGDIEKFHQEYPSTPEEAFIATGTNVFPMSKLLRCYERMDGIRGRLTRDMSAPRGVRFQPDSQGPLTLFSYPSDDTEWGVYFVGGDPTGTTRGDMAVIQVINRRTYEQVARWRGRIDPGGFAEELSMVGAYFNHAMISTETTGPGYMTIGRLIEANYPHLWRNRWADKLPGAIASTYGFPSTVKTKEWYVGHLLKMVVDGDLMIHDPVTFAEMRNYVTLDEGGYGNASDEDYDDTVSALGICCLCAATEPPLPPFGTAERASLPERITGAEAFDPEFWFEQEDTLAAMSEEY